MKNIRSVIDYELTWSQQSVMKNEFELRFGGELVAILRLPKMVGTTGIAESGDGSWTFERIGFWKSRSIVKASGSTVELGSYTQNTWKPGGVLQLPNGKKLVFRRNWRGISEFQTEAGETLFQIQTRAFFRVSATVRINRVALQTPELPWLVLFGFYLGVLARRDASTHAATS
jgi:hypothetical protein